MPRPAYLTCKVTDSYRTNLVWQTTMKCVMRILLQSSLGTFNLSIYVALISKSMS
jgi:hypothetical protein